MPNLNPVGSGARMLATKTNTRGECLVAVAAAILDGLPVLEHATTALVAWNDATTAHQHTINAPKDFPWFLSGAGGDGDTVISTGDGVTCIASDYMTGGVIHWGQIGKMTLADRTRQVGGKLLGWTDLFLGYTLTGTDPSGGGGVTPINPPVSTPSPKEDTMYVKGSTATVYAAFTDANGALRLRVCGVNEAAYASSGNLVVTGNDPTLTGLGAEAGWIGGAITAIPLPQVTVAGGTSGGTGPSVTDIVTALQPVVQAISDASDKNIQSWITALANLLNTDITTVLTALTAATSPLATSAALAALPAATAKLVPPIPTKITLPAQTGTLSN